LKPLKLSGKKQRLRQEDIMGHLVTKYRRSFEKLLICLAAAGLPLVLFQGLEVLQGFEMRVISYLTYHRGERAPHDDIVLVTVDDRSVAR
jgi:CHASE2 domain-containing sensor protein